MPFPARGVGASRLAPRLALLRHPAAGAARFRKADRDRLLAAPDLPSAAAAAQRAALAHSHCAFHLLRRPPGILSSHGLSFGVEMTRLRNPNTVPAVPRRGARTDAGAHGRNPSGSRNVTPDAWLDSQRWRSTQNRMLLRVGRARRMVGADACRG